MCRILGIRYTCGHTSSHRLSTCRGTRAKSKDGRAACCCYPDISRSLPLSCGPCQYSTFCAEWESRIQAARDALIAAQQSNSENQPGHSRICKGGAFLTERSPSQSSNMREFAEEVQRLTDQYESAAWMVRQTLPPQLKASYSRPSHNAWIRRSSSLCTEVKPEEIVLPEERHISERTQLQGPYSTFQSFFVGTYGCWGPHIDSALKNSQDKE